MGTEKEMLFCAKENWARQKIKGGMADETEASTAGFIFKNTLYQRIYIRGRFCHCDIYEEMFRGLASLD